MNPSKLTASALIWLLLTLPAVSAPSPGPTDAPPWPTRGWPRSTPRAQELDPLRLGTLVEALRTGEFRDIHSLLIVRNGYLVLEEYFGGYDAERLHTLQSVSKSVTSALVGIAIERGEFEGVREKVLDFFPQMNGIENLDDRKRAMTLEDLLTMRSGTDYHEMGGDSPHDRLNALDRGWDRFVLNRPMVRTPGTYFQYDSGGVILMSSMLKARTGMHADAYARKHLFPPLGISRYDWEKNREGHPHTGGGLDLLPRDMAKFGLLYLRGGRWEDDQVVPAEWVRESTRHQVTFDAPRVHVTGYGYLWWMLSPDPDGPGEQPIYAAMGFMGQYIFVVPEHDLVVVVTAGAHGLDERRPIEFLYTHVLPSVERSAPLPDRGRSPR